MIEILLKAASNTTQSIRIITFFDIQNICRGQNKNISTNELKLSDKVEKIVEKGENAGYQHFLLFPQCLKNTSLRHWIAW